MHMEVMMQICETERLVIRQLSLDDVPALTEILSDPEVMKYSIRGVCDEAATRKFVEGCVAYYEAHGVGPWALVDKSGSSLIGFCGVDVQVFHERTVRLYRLTLEQWRTQHNNAIHATSA